MKAQTLYDLREGTSFCSGADLHGFFMAEVGTPSPSGTVKIDGDAALAFIARKCEQLRANGMDL